MLACTQIHTNKMLENSFLGRDIDLWDLAGTVLQGFGISVVKAIQRVHSK